MSDDLASGRMIRRLDSHDLGYKTQVFLVDERDELVFSRSRSDDEDRVNAIALPSAEEIRRDSSRDIVKETPRIVGCSRGSPRPFGCR